MVKNKKDLSSHNDKQRQIGAVTMIKHMAKFPDIFFYICTGLGNKIIYESCFSLICGKCANILWSLE
jgi:hypothetical protein